MRRGPQLVRGLRSEVDVTGLSLLPDQPRYGVEATKVYKNR